MKLPRWLAFVACSLILCNSYGASSSREDCVSTQDEEDLLQCTKAGLYDPCDDAGIPSRLGQCAYVQSQIADHRMAMFEAAIVTKLSRRKESDDALSSFSQSQKSWQSYRDAHCKFESETIKKNSNESSSFLLYGFCFRRLTEQRTNELESVLRYRPSEAELGYLDDFPEFKNVSLRMSEDAFLEVLALEKLSYRLSTADEITTYYVSVPRKNGSANFFSISTTGFAVEFSQSTSLGIAPASDQSEFMSMKTLLEFVL